MLDYDYLIGEEVKVCDVTYVIAVVDGYPKQVGYTDKWLSLHVKLVAANKIKGFGLLFEKDKNGKLRRIKGDYA